MRQQARTERRFLEQAADRIERAGCDLCGITLGGPIPHHFGYIKDKMSGVCTGCIDGLDGRPCASGLFEIAPWLEDDRKWFRANPARTHRLREPVGEEVKAMTLAAGFTPPIPRLDLAWLLPFRDMLQVSECDRSSFYPGQSARTPRLA